MTLSIQDLKSRLEKLSQSAESAFKSADNSSELYDLKTRHIGGKSDFQKLMREMKNLSPADKPLFGKYLNEKKKLLESLYSDLFERLKKQEWEQKAREEKNRSQFTGPRLPERRLASGTADHSKDGGDF